jgi:hypothetical protein
MTVGDGVVTSFKRVSYCTAKTTTFNLCHLTSISQWRVIVALLAEGEHSGAPANQQQLHTDCSELAYSVDKPVSGSELSLVRISSIPF